MSANPILQDTSLDQLAALAGPRARWSGPARISLELPLVERSRQLATERRLNFLRGVCGCQAGALFAVAALVWSIASPPDAGAAFAIVLRAAAFVIGMAILGKVLALVAARALFAVQVNRLARHTRLAAQGGLP